MLLFKLKKILNIKVYYLSFKDYFFYKIFIIKEKKQYIFLLTIYELFKNLKKLIFNSSYTFNFFLYENKTNIKNFIFIICLFLFSYIFFYYIYININILNSFKIFIYLLITSIFILIFNIIYLLFFNKKDIKLTIKISILKLLISISFLNWSSTSFEIDPEFILFKNWIDFFNFNFIFGIDSISLSFIFLSDLLNFICILLLINNVKYKQNLYKILLISCNLLLTLIFISLDLFIFYFFFELILIPMFFLITAWGSRLRKIHAALQFFLYTLIGSLIFLIGLIYLNINYNTTDILVLQYLNISKNDQIFLWLTFFLAFAIKVPIYPFHLWLPEAHVEAPTTGSVLLAGILLKLGTYGFLKFFFLILPYSSIFFLPIINMLCCLGILYSSFTIIRQIDIKKIIAYSSIIHMNYTILGLFNSSFLSFYGSFYLMLSHGIISSALFICVGYIYERYHTRIIYYYGNIVMIMPLLTIFFFLFTLGNIGFPGTSSFIGEFLIFIGIFETNKFLAYLILFGLFISVIYSFLLFNKIFFYNSINIKNFIIKYSDINQKEIIILIILLLFMFFYGIYTKSFSSLFYYKLNDLYYNSKYKLYNL